MNSRTTKILSCIDVSKQIGLEIGPLMSPIISRNMGDICYIDVATTEELKSNYKFDPNVDVDKIVEVDYVWGESSLLDLVGKDAPFDYLVASHVVEHVPDFVGWLNEIQEILKPNGILSLAIPDKRYCFDYHRPLSTMGQVLESFLRQSKRPSTQQIFDSSTLFATCNGKIAWDLSESIENNSFDFPTSEIDVWQKVCDNFSNNQYIDSHCWVFTPQSFLQILLLLTKLDLLNFTVKEFYPTSGCEFYVSLQSIDTKSKSLNDVRKLQIETINLAMQDIPTEEYELIRLHKAYNQISEMQKCISEMQNSKFWKLRTQWIKLKEILRLNSNNL